MFCSTISNFAQALGELVLTTITFLKTEFRGIKCPRKHLGEFQIGLFMILHILNYVNLISFLVRLAD